MLTFPEVIYLHRDGDDILWCEDRISEDDVQYFKSSGEMVLRAVRAELESEHGEITFISRAALQELKEG